MRVVEIFDSLQGEGVWAGTPMTFIRLAGCNAPDLGLGCLQWCDTRESWDPAAGSEMEVAGAVAAAEAAGLGRVCVTGGEPLLQGEALADLVRALQASGCSVHLETNGTLALPPGVVPDWVAVSPKPPDHCISPGLAGMVHEIKVVVDDAFDPRVVESLARAHPRAVVCLQPEWSRRERATEAARAAVMAHPAWRLSLQLHKVLGIR